MLENLLFPLVLLGASIAVLPFWLLDLVGLVDMGAAENFRNFPGAGEGDFSQNPARADIFTGFCYGGTYR
jgi:hypothetical protein